jgi:large subunit ribosomal protein L4
MAKIAVYNLQGKEAETLDLSPEVFEVPANNELLHQVYVSLMNNERLGVYAHTKTRAEVAGSGKKPWRQKGTGRARVGEVRNPVWRKGGIVFGPRNNRNFQSKVNQKMRRKAVMVALSEKVREGKLVILENVAFTEKKTKLFAATLRALKLEKKSVMVGLAPAEKEYEKMMRNVDRVEGVLAKDVNVVDLLNHQYFVTTKEGIKNLEKRFLAS